MTKTFMYLRVEELPPLAVGEEIVSRHQKALPIADNEAATTLKCIGLAEDDYFEKFHVTHQVERDVLGIYNQKPMNRYLEIVEFNVFVNRTAGYMLASAGQVDVRSAFRRLQTAQTPVKVEEAEIDLRKFQGLGETTGGWFGELQIADVSTAGLFGTSTVVESDEWKRYAEDGELNALLMRVVDEGSAVRSLMVTRKRLIVLYKDEGEAENLRYVRYLQDTIDDLLSEG